MIPRLNLNHLLTNFLGALRVNAWELTHSVVHIEVYGRGVRSNQIVTTGVTRNLATYITLNRQLVDTYRQIINLLPYIPVVAVPSLEAVVHIAQRALHQFLISLSERTTGNVSTSTCVDIPTFSSTRVYILVIIESRIHDKLGIVLTFIRSVLCNNANCFHPIDNLRYLFFELIIGQLNLLKNILYIEAEIVG